MLISISNSDLNLRSGPPPPFRMFCVFLILSMRATGHSYLHTDKCAYTVTEELAGHIMVSEIRKLKELSR